jgi:tetrahydromethanopterin S-methyltransferase subunit C
LFVAEKKLLCFCFRDIIHLFVAEISIAKSVVCTVVGIAFWNLGFVDFFGKRFFRKLAVEKVGGVAEQY